MQRGREGATGGMLSTLRLFANAIFSGIPGKPGRLDTATRMAMDADFSARGEPGTPPREPQRKVSPIEELERILGLGLRALPATALPERNSGQQDCRQRQKFFHYPLRIT